MSFALFLIAPFFRLTKDGLVHIKHCSLQDGLHQNSAGAAAV
jgi:hypothetical protein